MKQGALQPFSIADLAFPVDDLANDDALKSERKVTGVSQDRHFKNMKPVNKRDAIFPSGKAKIIPHFPKESADKSGEGSRQNAMPSISVQPAEKVFFVC